MVVLFSLVPGAKTVSCRNELHLSGATLSTSIYGQLLENWGTGLHVRRAPSLTDNLQQDNAKFSSNHRVELDLPTARDHGLRSAVRFPLADPRRLQFEEYQLWEPDY